jgi:predicted nucleic acid-binding protein
MARLVVDSWAWVEYLSGTEKGLKLKGLIEDGSKLFTSIISLAEVVSAARRMEMSVTEVKESITSNSDVVNVDQDLSAEAGLLHNDMKKKVRDFGLGDAFVVVTARRLNIKILTGDPHFKHIKEAVMI